MPPNLENLAAATGLEKITFHPNPKERQGQTMFKLPHNCTHLTQLAIMLKIAQARLQQYLNHKLPDVQVGFRKGRGTRDQTANICWFIKKSKRVPEKHLFLLYCLCQSLWLCGSPQTVENSSWDGNTRPSYLPPEKSVGRSRSNS